MVAMMLQSSDKPPLSNVPLPAADGEKETNQALPDKKEQHSMKRTTAWTKQQVSSKRKSHTYK